MPAPLPASSSTSRKLILSQKVLDNKEIEHEHQQAKESQSAASDRGRGRGKEGTQSARGKVTPTVNTVSTGAASTMEPKSYYESQLHENGDK
jgi:hypothetical protein